MDAIIRFFKKLSILFTRERFHRELEEEMAFHREQQEKTLRARASPRRGEVRGHAAIWKCCTAERKESGDRRISI